MPHSKYNENKNDKVLDYISLKDGDKIYSKIIRIRRIYILSTIVVVFSLFVLGDNIIQSLFMKLSSIIDPSDSLEQNIQYLNAIDKNLGQRYYIMMIIFLIGILGAVLYMSHFFAETFKIGIPSFNKYNFRPRFLIFSIGILVFIWGLNGSVEVEISSRYWLFTSIMSSKYIMIMGSLFFIFLLESLIFAFVVIARVITNLGVMRRGS